MGATGGLHTYPDGTSGPQDPGVLVFWSAPAFEDQAPAGCTLLVWGHFTGAATAAGTVLRVSRLLRCL